MNPEYTENLILKLCAQPRSLDYISHRLSGVDPITAYGFLKDLERANKVRLQEDLWLTEENARKEISEIISPDPETYLKKYMGHFDLLKKPHPLDFEWRNSMSTVNYLTTMLHETNGVNDNILILGMPTLFASICKMDIPQSVAIVERNQGVINSLRELSHSTCKVIESDIFNTNPDKIGLYSTVIMDPPWYKEHFFQFIWVAARCLKLGGQLIISIPPMNTRPGVDKERIDWFTFCQDQGLCLENLFANKLEYSVPFFEWNAIRAAGASATPFWRKGDLAIFRKLNNHAVDRPKYTEEASLWKEIEYKDIRIRIKIESNLDKEDVTLESIVKLDILPTVSSRDERRKAANVWTSGNRIFKTNAPLKLYTHLKYISEGIPVDSGDYSTANDFLELISLENQEYNDYLQWLYHEMERTPS